MLLIDRRVGSKDLYPPLKKLGLPADLVELDYGDLAFEGRGPNATSVLVGIELKTLPDLVNSLRTRRLARRQLPGLLKTYEHAWLVVEGLWRPDRQGELTMYQGPRRRWRPLHGRMSSSEMEKRLLTLEMCGLHVRYTTSRVATLAFVVSLYRWFTDKTMEQHQSHIAIHGPLHLVPISRFRQAVATFPEIGLKTSLAVERHFEGSLDRACTADADEWAAIETRDDKGKTRRIGTKHAEQIVKFCRGET